MFNYINIRGLIPQTVQSKVPYVQDYIKESNSTAFVLTETWLNDSHLVAETRIEGYTFIRMDRHTTRTVKGRSSGGVGIYIRDNYAANSEIVFTFGNGVIEAMGVMIKPVNLLLIATYRSPDNRNTRGKRSTNKEFSPYLTALRNFLCSLQSPTPDILLMGDYNLPHANWLTGECIPGATSDEQTMVKNLYELTLEHFLVNQIDVPTHRGGNTLDLVITNNADLIHDISVSPSAVSDHFNIECSVTYNRTENSNTTENPETISNEKNQGFGSLNFFDESTNWEALEEDLTNYDWLQEFRGQDTSEMMQRFLSVTLSIARKWVPERSPSRDSSARKRKIPRHRKALMRKRTRLKKQYVSAKSSSKRDVLFHRLVNTEKQLNKSHEDQRDFEERKAIEKIRSNPKFFFSFGRKFSKVRIGVGPLINTAKRLISNPAEIAEILSEQYSSVFSTPVHSRIPVNELFPDIDTHDTLNDIVFCESDLEDAMNELSTNAAPGPDLFPAVLLKKCSHALARPLTKIWKKSLISGEIPDICKFATITPIHKGKSKALPKNYRPVALTSHLVKIFEKVVRKQVVNYLHERNLFNTSQHGFLEGRSCLSQLLSHFDRITSELENGFGVDVIYLDFAKAFDKVDHGIALKKISDLGIKGCLGRWIHSFLTGRFQAVVVEGRKAKPKPVSSGVPQGSVLGPLLFLILIGDIDKDVATSFLSSFADDTRVGKGISSVEDTRQLQADLESIYTWSVNNNMSFNSDKFELMRYRSKESRDSQLNSCYLDNNGQAIEEAQQVRDLGVIMTNDATFTSHMHEKCKSVKALISWILRTFRSREPLPMLTLWKTQVLCHLDYCSQLWSPTKTGAIQSLELLQKAFFSKVKGLRSRCYWDQLIQLKAYSLERRRERYRIIYIWRILEGQVPNLLSTPVEYHLNVRRGRLCKIPRVSPSAPGSIQSVRYASLAVKGPRLFNSLPMALRNLSGCTTEQFKRNLDRFLAKIPDQPLIPGLTQCRRIDTNSIIDWVASPYLLMPDMQYQTEDRPDTAGGGYDVMT